MNLSRVLLAAAFVFVGLIGGSEAGQFLAGVRGITALVAGAVIALYLIRAPRRHDRLDLVVLAGLLAFLLTCLTSSMPRLSFDAATSALAYTAAFYVSRDAVADPEGRRLALAVLGLTGALVAIAFFLLWAAGWVRWFSVPDAGIPPVGLALPPVLYGHHYLVATLVALLAPACVALARKPLIWPVGFIGALAAIAVILMSGSRTIWLAAIAALVVRVGLSAQFKRPRLRWILPTVALGVIVGVLLGGQIAGRVGTVSTVEGRLEIYRASLDRWLDSPLLGHGPGTYSAQMTVAGHDELLTHGHNALVQMLVEGGVVGVTAMLLIASGVAFAALRSERRNTVAIAGLVVFGVGCMTDNPSAFPFLVVPAVVWAGLATPRESITASSTQPWVSRATLVVAAAVGLASVAVIGGAWFYERASTLAQQGNDSGVVEALRTAEMLDPEYPLYQRDLGVWLLARGQTTEARAHLEHAIRANPGDPAAHRALAIAASESGDSDAMELARAALALQDDDAANLLTVAYVARHQGDASAAQEALQQAMRYEPWMAATGTWSEEFGDGVADLLAAAHDSWPAGQDADDNHQEARVWLAAMVGTPLPPAELSSVEAAVAAAIDCQPDEALELLGPPSTAAVVPDWVPVRIIVARMSGEPVDDYLILASLRRPVDAFLATNEPAGASPFSALAHDAQFYGRRSIAPPEGMPIFPSPESGLSAWLRDPIGAADRGAPDSGLATCR
jgi:O-antigen ligase